MSARARLLFAGLLVAAGCHLALGLEEAEEITPPAPNCATDDDCADDEPCTADRCEAGRCQNSPLDARAPDEMQTPGDCRALICRLGTLAEVNDDGDLPDDGNDCKDDVCMLGEIGHPNISGGTPCTSDGGTVCNGLGACSECFSNLECTPPDSCGGGGEPWLCGCTPGSCADAGKTCGTVDIGCGMLTDCNNGKDGDETDDDCGGNVNACATRCPPGADCDVPADCENANCSGGICQ